MNCDVFQCFRMFIASDESNAFAAEKNAEQLGAVYASNVLEAQRSLDEALRTGRTVLTALRVAKDQGNALAGARAQAAARSSATRVRELRATIARNEQLQTTCERAAGNLRDARMHRSTVSTLSDVQRQFKSMQLDGLAEATVRTMSDISVSADVLEDTSRILARSMVGGGEAATDADADADMAELEALIGMEPVPSPVAPTPAPIPQAMASRGVSLPTAEAYAASLLRVAA